MASPSQAPRDGAEAQGMMMLATSWSSSEEVVQALVREDGVPVDVPDPEGRTPLMLVAQDRNAEAARWLVDLGADVNARNKRGTTPLMYAAKEGHLDIAELLVKAGADVNARNEEGLTALMATTIRPYNEGVVRFLVEQGADVNPPLYHGLPILIRLMLVMEHPASDAVAAIHLLIDAGTDVNAASDEGETPVMTAAKYGALDLLRCYFLAGANANAADHNGWTPLMSAAQSGILDIARCLVDAGAEVNAVAADGMTPLTCAVDRFGMEMIRYLVANGADVNRSVTAAQSDGRTALMFAAQTSESDVQCLLDAGADVNAFDRNGRTPLHYAASSGNLDIVRCLVEAGADVNLTRPGRSTPLIEVARSASLEMMQYLIQAGADVNKGEDFDGSTALIKASLRNSLDCVRLLIDAGADVNAANVYGRTALSCAATSNSLDVVRLLVKSGASLNSLEVRVGTPLMSAASRGNLDAVKLLVDNGADVAAVSEDGMTALMVASWAKTGFDVVAYLVGAGADVNAVDAHGLTPLMYATDPFNAHNLSKTVGILIDAGADPNATREDGRTALMDAAERGHLEAVQVLIDSGADVSQADQRGRTAMFFAAKNARSKCQHLLARSISRPRETRLHGGGNAVSSWTARGWFIPPFEVALRAASDVGEYRATWLDADVTLKLFIPDASLATFDEEVTVWYQLRHPNVIKLYGACNLGHHFFVCEFASRGTLTDYLAACESSGIRRTPWKFLHEAALAVAYLHQRRIVHGNLRPQKILVGSDLAAKISDFGLSGSTGAASGVFGLERWHSPEQLKGGPASFASDVWGLWLCIFQVITGRIPWRRGFGIRDGRNWDPYGRPDQTRNEPGALSAELRFLASRMCGQDPQTRVEASDVVRLLERYVDKEAIEARPYQPEPEPLLSVNEYNDGEICRVWSKLSAQASRHAAQDVASVFLHDIEEVYERLSASRQPWTTLHRFHSLLKDFERAIVLGSHQNRILRLSSTRATDGNLETFRRRIDALWATLDSSGDATAPSRRMRREEQRKRQLDVFVSEVSRTLLVMSELASEDDRIAFLTLLKREIDAHGADYTQAQLAVMQQAYDDMTLQAGSDVLMTTPAWFLPWYELVIDTANWLGDGGFGSVYLAKWLDSEVVVKQVKTLGEGNSSFWFSDATTETSSSVVVGKSASVRGDDAEKQKMRRMFEREVDIWFGLSHPHVVRLFGACHVGTPFFACEYASNGSLDKYLRSQPGEMWPKLYEVALGIQYLHARGVIHGDLKCNNIVVGNDRLAKVTDFGLSSSAALTGKDSAELTGAWHWVAPECLERGASAQSTASDVYSLGMCIVEAMRVVEAATVKKDEPRYVSLPWGDLDNAVVKHYVVRQQKLPLRPEICSDDAQWALVQTMCAHDAASRMKIGTVVDELAKLAGVHAGDDGDKALRSQPVQAVVEDMKRCCYRPGTTAPSDRDVLFQIYGLLWGRIEHIALDNELDGVEKLRLLVERAASATTKLEDAENTLMQFTEHALRGYALHRELDKLIDANRWRVDGDDARVHDWKAKCYEFTGVASGGACLDGVTE